MEGLPPTGSPAEEPTTWVLHDLRNYLDAIVHLAAALEALDEPARHPQLVGEIRTMAVAAAGLARRLLEHRLEQAQPVSQCDVADVVRNALPVLQAAAGRGIELRTELAPELGVLAVEPERLVHILFNLVVNAAAATPDQGRVLIQVRRTRIDGRPHVELSVTDFGEGMAEDVGAQADDPLPTSRPGPGTGLGLGLRMVRAIARDAGGAVELDSRQGEGTVVRLLLPAD